MTDNADLADALARVDSDTVTVELRRAIDDGDWVEPARLTVDGGPLDADTAGVIAGATTGQLAAALRSTASTEAASAELQAAWLTELADLAEQVVALLRPWWPADRALGDALDHAPADVAAEARRLLGRQDHLALLTGNALTRDEVIEQESRGELVEVADGRWREVPPGEHRDWLAALWAGEKDAEHRRDDILDAALARAGTDPSDGAVAAERAVAAMTEAEADEFARLRTTMEACDELRRRVLAGRRVVERQPDGSAKFVEVPADRREPILADFADWED